MKEHIAAVKNRQINKSAVAEHLLDMGTNHWMELHDPKILSTDRHYHTRVIREAIEIKKHKNFNREDGFKLSPAWNPVINKCKPRVSPLSISVNPDTVSVVCRSEPTDFLCTRTEISDNSRVVVDQTARCKRRRRAPAVPS